MLPSVAQQKIDKGGMLVLRPDSGDPIEAVIMALEAAGKVFGVTENTKGFKVPKGCSVIYGDGVNLETMKKILDAMLDKGFSAEVRSRILWLCSLVYLLLGTVKGLLLKSVPFSFAHIADLGTLRRT